MAILALSVLALGVALYVGRTGAQTTPPATAKPGTRIALLNLSHVINNYDKFKAYKEEIKTSIAPFQKRETDIKKTAETLLKEKQNPTTTAARREAIDKDLTKLERDMQDLKTEFGQLMGKKQEQQYVILYGDVRTVAESYAQSQQYDMVLHFTDSTEPREYWSPQNVIRKMQAGALVPLYYKAGIDISADVIKALNENYKQAGARPAAAPAPAGAAPAGVPKH